MSNEIELSPFYPDGVPVKLEREDGTERVRLICARCATAAKSNLRLFATLSGLGDHVTLYHHEVPRFYLNHTPEELNKEITSDDGE